MESLNPDESQELEEPLVEEQIELPEEGGPEPAPAPRPAPGAVVQMPAAGRTLAFPREDNYYRKKESLPFDEAQTRVWRSRPQLRTSEAFKEWMAYLLLGFGIGFTGFCMDSMEEALSDLFAEKANDLINMNGDRQAYVAPWLLFSLCCGACGLLASLITTYYGQPAAGSGVAEFIGYANGVNYAGFIGVPTFITKVLCVTLAVIGRLCVGKEGPLAHIGALIGVMVLYIPGLGFEFMRNDEKRRCLAAAGASAGVSVAFGAPIGGTLFAYEMSKPNTFWRFEMIWRVFLSCAVGTFTLGLLINIKEGDFTGKWTGGTLKFGAISTSNDTDTLAQLPGAVVIGIVGGAMGAFFVSINFKMNGIVRKALLTTQWMKPVETFFFSFVTSTFFFFTPRVFNECKPKTLLTGDEKVYEAWCQDSPGPTFSPLASLFWSTEGAVIKGIMSDAVTPNLAGTLAFLGVWYFFTIITYGTNVPAGLFLPGMIIGCTLGDLYTTTVMRASIGNREAMEKSRKKYIVLGCGGFMAGYTRMTYSLAVILLETSQDISLFVPMILCILVSNSTGYLFTRSLYERAVRGKQMPIIIEKVPEPCLSLRAGDIMASPVVTLQTVDTIANVRAALATSHHAFPLVNAERRVVGLIPRNFIVVLIQNKAFYSMRDKSLS